MCICTNYSNVVRFEVSTAVTMMIIILRATRRHLPEDDNHYSNVIPRTPLSFSFI
jgi:hypothetical protein